MINQCDLTNRLRVNAANPGEFMACCGLAEVADRICDGGVESYFDEGYFILLGAIPIIELLKMVVNIEPRSLEKISQIQVDKKIAPLELRFSEDQIPRLKHLKGAMKKENGSYSLLLDAWLRLKVNREKVALESDPYWKFWGGHQDVLKIWSDLRDQIRDQLNKNEIDSNPEDLFQKRHFMTGRFGFDPQAAWNALDVGYSPNDQKQPVATSPALELLALIGLQRVRPMIVEDFQFEYATWGQSLNTTTAVAAAYGILTASPAARFRAQIIRRGQYGGLSHATRISGGG